MSSNIFRVTMFIAGMALLSAFFAVTTVQAARPDMAVCDGLSGNGFGVCRAAVSSGCETDGRNVGSNHCDRLAANFTKLAGNDPVWLASVNSDSDFGGLDFGVDDPGSYQ